VTEVDVALVLAVDCSSSVDAGDYRLQMDGIAAALRNPQLLEAIEAGPFGRVALALVQWSSPRSQYVAIPWGIIANASDLEGAARQAETAERQWKPGGTAMAEAIDFSAALLGALQVSATRRVIDVSGDGEENEGGNVERARSHALALGITINGLPITYGSPTLESYYSKFVIGGDGAFLLPTRDIKSFHDAIAQKLVREVGMKRTA
jgi:hypothetical protein